MSGGRAYEIVMDRSFTYLAPPPFSDCGIDENNNLITELDDTSLVDYFVKSNYSYTQATCKRFCLQTKIAGACNCTTSTIPLRLDAYNVCTSDAQLDCVNAYQNRTFAEFCSCPIDCFKEIFTFGTTQSLLTMNVPKDKRLATNFSNHTDFVKSYTNNLVALTVYYNMLLYTRVTEKPAISDVSTISNIGGQIGLFLGMSLVGIVELAEISYFIVNIYYRYKKRRRQIVDGGGSYVDNAKGMNDWKNGTQRGYERNGDVLTLSSKSLKVRI